MAFSSPGVQLFDSSDVELGTGSNPLRIDPTGTTAQPVTDNGGSLTVDGTVAVSSVGGTVTVAGTVTANAGSGTFNNQQSNVQLDFDTGAGTQNLTLWGIALPASGGAVAGGTSANPLRMDPTGTTAQPVTDNGGSLTVDGTVAVSSVGGTVTVSGTVTADQGAAAALSGHWPVQVTDGTNVMPTMDVVGRAGFMKVTDGVETLLVNPDGSINVVTSGSSASAFRVDMYEADVAAKTYFALIQVSNGSGDYKHTSGTAIKLHKLFANILKSKNSDKWDVEIGTILAINGTNASIGWVLPGSMRIHDTGAFQKDQNIDFENDLLDLSVSAGDYTKIAAGKKETTTDINTGVTIDDVAGSAITPAVGDLIMRVAPNGSVGGTILVQQHVAYEVI